MPSLQTLNGSGTCFTLEKLSGIYSLCFDLDVRVKQGKIKDRLALEILLVELAQAAGSSRTPYQARLIDV